MSSSLGTLWFGADIDLTALKNKINQGNQSVLDALKMNYDPQSYQQMVSRLKSQLASETFEIKLTANTQNIVNNVRNATKTGGLNFSGLDEMSDKIVRQEALVNALRAKVAELKAEYDKLNGISRKNRWEDARAEFAREKASLDTLKATRREYTRSTQQQTAALRDAASAARQLNSDHMRLNATLFGGIHVSTQLGSALSSLFAVDAARQFLNNVIEIGGQLEKQRISMGAIVGDTARANELFKQIKDLAIKSPFGVVELDQYSKQLAAYGIEQSQLFDMTKRLADISAGAGQDIGRLALALGHVKSATYLTGITLRQFSMNNIPMLKMLADYYTEVEKRAVSTAEVQKRISNRQVSYEDVEKQIIRMTDEGGKFYNMQEKISESLQAKFKNLRDSFDIMYGEIAESAVGDALKGLATILTQMSRHWSEFMSIIAAGASVFGVYRLALLPVNKALMQFGNETVLTSTRLNAQRIAMGISTAETKALSAATLDLMVRNGLLSKQQLLTAVATKRLTVAQAELAATNFNVAKGELLRLANMGRLGLAMRTLTIGARSLGIALKGLLFNPMTLAITGFMAAVEIFMHFKNKSDETAESVNNLINTANEGFDNLQKTLNKFQKGVKDTGSLSGGIKEITEAIKNYTPNSDQVLKHASALETLQERYEYLRNELESTKNAYSDLEKTADYVTNADSETGNWINDTFTKNVKDYLDDLKNVRKAEQEFLYHRVSISKALDKVASGNASFNKSRYNEDGTLKSIKEQIEILKSIKIPNVGNAFSVFSQVLRQESHEAGVALGEWSVALSDADKRMRDEVMPDLIKFADKLDISYKETEGWGENWKKNGDHVKTALIAVTKELEKIPNMTDTVKNDLLDKIFNKHWKLNIDFNTGEVNETLTGWQKEVQDYLDENHIYIRLSMSSTREDLIKQVEEEKKKAQTAADNAGKVLIGIGFKLDNLPTNLPSPLATPWNTDALDTYSQQTDYVNKLNEAINKFNLNVKEKTPKSTGNKVDEQLKQWKEELKEIENFYKVYKRNAEYMSKDDAIQRAIDSGVFSDPKKLPKNIDDYLNVLRDFKKKVEAEMGKKSSTERKSFLTDLLTKIDEKEFEIKTKEVADKFLKTLQDNISKQAEKYNIYKTLLEKTGDKSFASAAFDDGMIWDDFAKDLEKKLKALSGEEVVDYKMTNVKAEEHYKNIKGAYDLWKKIVETVSGNYNNLLTDSAEAINKTLTISKQILKIEKEISDLKDKQGQFSNGSVEYKSYQKLIDAKQKELRTKKIEQENDAADALQLYSAPLSMTAAKAEDVGQKLRENLVQSLKDGSISADEYIRRIKKIEKQIESARFGKDFFDAFKSGGIEGVKKLKFEIEDQEWIDSSNRLEEAEERLREAIEANKESHTEETQNKVNEAQQAVKDAESNHTAAKKNRDASKKNYESARSFNKTISMIAYAISAMVQTLNDAKQAAASFGEDLDANMNEFGQYYTSFLEGANTALNRMQSGDFAGAISGLVFGSISGIAQKHDATLKQDQKRSELIVKTFDNVMSIMEKRLESLMGTIDELKIDDKTTLKLYNYLGVQNPETVKAVKNGTATFEQEAEYHLRRTLGLYKDSIEEIVEKTDTDKAVIKAIQSGTYFDTALANLMIQRDELKRQLADEEDMKDKDESKILDMQEQIAELEIDIDNFAKDMAEKLYGIDFKSWANDLADALVSAWAAGENGAEAYKKKVSEILKDLGVKMITERFILKALTPIMDDFIDQYEKDGGVLTEKGMDILSGMYGLANNLQKQTNDFMDGINEIAKRNGADLKDTETSSTGSSIKGVTEQTADLLASYINAIRADVSVNRAMTATYYPQFLSVITQVSVLSQTQVTLQQQIASNTLRNADAADRIYDILHRVSPDGTKIRVG